ncbi:MAG: hypothetical protein SF187_13650 [Deltaproteobacteria bacterium]|nr:hypothetical protein [Deltaproteobacteria bacterium]
MAKPTALATRPALAQEAAEKLERALRGFRGELTIADASEKSGLALQDAAGGLHELVARYNGHLGATDKGELLFRFPDGLVKPNEGAPRWLKKVGRALAGVGRFIVRAWVSVVVVVYALAFGAILIALAARNDRDDDGVGDAVAVVLRVVFEALYWTFHPFSPFYRPYGFGDRRARREKKPPFYERVNRFVFGPPPKPEPTFHEKQAQLAGEIRRLQGRIGVSDVMRVTGLARGEADALLSRLMLDFDGDVEVTEDGAIVYVFKQLRQTALAKESAPARPFWLERLVASPITGNPIESNMLIAGLNAFNLLASGYMLSNGFTLERLMWVLSHTGRHSPGYVLDPPPPDGVPLVLGLVPFAFSSALFALPVVRAFRHRSQVRKVQAENGRRAVAAHIMKAAAEIFPERDVVAVFEQGAGRPGTPQEILAAVRSLGGDFDIEQDLPVYRFAELAREQRALVALRAQATKDEQSAGRVIFSSDS